MNPENPISRRHRNVRHFHLLSVVTWLVLRFDACRAEKKLKRGTFVRKIWRQRPRAPSSIPYNAYRPEPIDNLMAKSENQRRRLAPLPEASRFGTPISNRQVCSHRRRENGPATQMGCGMIGGEQNMPSTNYTTDTMAASCRILLRFGQRTRELQGCLLQEDDSLPCGHVRSADEAFLSSETDHASR